MERSRPFGAIHCSVLLEEFLKGRRVILWTDGSEPEVHAVAPPVSVGISLGARGLVLGGGAP
eukprot:6378786-Prymnesium_polylepis.2